MSCRNDEAAKQSPRAINTLPTTTPTPGPCWEQEPGCRPGTQLPLLDTQPDGCLGSLARWLLRLSASRGCLVTSLQCVCVWVCVCALLLLLTEFWFLVYHLIARPHAKPICRVAACGLRYSYHTTCCCPPLPVTCPHFHPRAAQKVPSCHFCPRCVWVLAMFL